MRELYNELTNQLGLDGTTDEDLRFYNNVEEFRNDTMFDTDKDFREYIENKFDEDSDELNREIIVLDRIGSPDGMIFTSDDSKDSIRNHVIDYCG